MNNELINTGNTGILLQQGGQGLALSSLSSPAVAAEFTRNILALVPTKKKIGLTDFYLFLSGSPLACEIADSLSRALTAADASAARALWKEYSAELQAEIIIPDAGVLNAELVTKLDIEGLHVRTAFLRKHSILPVEKAPYAYTYGAMTAEDSTELVLILKQLKSIKPHGQMLIDEFFEEIDLRILYMYAMSEAEQYASDDYDGGAFLQLAMESQDTLPQGTPLLCWLQENVPDVFSLLREEILNPLWKENRAFFWETWLQQNRPTTRGNFFEKARGDYRPDKDGISYDDAFDDVLKVNENDSE